MLRCSEVWKWSTNSDPPSQNTLYLLPRPLLCFLPPFPSLPPPLLYSLLISFFTPFSSSCFPSLPFSRFYLLLFLPTSFHPCPLTSFSVPYLSLCSFLSYFLLSHVLLTFTSFTFTPCISSFSSVCLYYFSFNIPPFLPDIRNIFFCLLSTFPSLLAQFSSSPTSPSFTWLSYLLLYPYLISSFPFLPHPSFPYFDIYLLYLFTICTSSFPFLPPWLFIAS